MASTRPAQDSDNVATLLCTELDDLDSPETPVDFDEIVISTVEINSWNLPSILTQSALKIEADRHRLVEESSYFRGLLCGSFSDSGRDSISIHWNVESFLSVLRFIFGCHLDITSDNFIPLNEAALFFGIEKLLLKCHVWLDELASYKGLQSSQLCLDGLIRIWTYGLEHANDSIRRICTSYLARNFMWALSFDFFSDVPDKLLCSCIEHPDLTIDSEKYICDAILVWLTKNAGKSEGWSDNVYCDKRFMFSQKGLDTFWNRSTFMCN